MEDWFSVYNGLYLIVLILGAVATLVTKKYRKVVKELSELAESLKKGYADKKLTKAEKDEIMKEALDVVKSIIQLKWRF
ncbi:hypothetical protein [uncultured Mediterranean phage]|nr:hypothetical protein [uncultured Mediterranean phage]